MSLTGEYSHEQHTQPAGTRVMDALEPINHRPAEHYYYLHGQITVYLQINYFYQTKIHELKNIIDFVKKR